MVQRTPTIPETKQLNGETSNNYIDDTISYGDVYHSAKQDLSLLLSGIIHTCS